MRMWKYLSEGSEAVAKREKTKLKKKFIKTNEFKLTKLKKILDFKTIIEKYLKENKEKRYQINSLLK